MGGKGSKSPPPVEFDAHEPRPMYQEPNANNAGYRPPSLANYEESVSPGSLNYGEYWNRGPATPFYSPPPGGKGMAQGGQGGQGKGMLPGVVQMLQQSNQAPHQGWSQTQPEPQSNVGSQATVQGTQYGALPGMVGGAVPVQEPKTNYAGSDVGSFRRAPTGKVAGWQQNKPSGENPQAEVVEPPKPDWSGSNINSFRR